MPDGNKNLIYLDSYVLQKDMRIRMPKAIIENLNLKKGESMLDIFFDNDNNSIIIKKKK